MKPAFSLALALAAVGVGAFVEYRRTGSLLGGSSRRRRSNLRGEHEAHELLLFCENDGDLYRQQVKPIEANLAKKLAKGVYDHEKAKKLWGYLAESCARKYVKEFGDERTPWHKMFSTADRRGVAKAFADSWRQEHGG